jgi:hypothetical protein
MSQHTVDESNVVNSGIQSILEWIITSLLSSSAALMEDPLAFWEANQKRSHQQPPSFCNLGANSPIPKQIVLLSKVE